MNTLNHRWDRHVCIKDPSYQYMYGLIQGIKGPFGPVEHPRSWGVGHPRLRASDTVLALYQPSFEHKHGGNHRWDRHVWFKKTFGTGQNRVSKVQLDLSNTLDRSTPQIRGHPEKKWNVLKSPNDVFLGYFGVLFDPFVLSVSSSFRLCFWGNMPTSLVIPDHHTKSTCSKAWSKVCPKTGCSKMRPRPDPARARNRKSHFSGFF